MDIHILHDGKETGPFTEEAAHALLKQGAVLVNDPAWRPGMADWIPLLDLLHPTAASSAPAPSAAPEPIPREPATARQQAFLAFMHIPFGASITREEASHLVNEAMENPKDPARIARWNEERLVLHPELFAAEIQTRKENRSQRYLEICQGEGAPYFEKVTKAHCQVLLAHLDVRFPNWDAYEREATEKYFFPALAEKFPQLVTAEGKGKFKFDDATPVVRKTAKHTPVVARTLPPTPPSVFGALLRGLMLGLVILGSLWGGREYLTKKRTARKSALEQAPGASTPAPEVPAPPAAPTETPKANDSAPPPAAAPAPAAGGEPVPMKPATDSDAMKPPQ